MKLISKLSAPVSICFVSVLMTLCIFFMASCSTATKTAKPLAGSSGELQVSKSIANSSKNDSKSNQSVEQRLDDISIRLGKIEQTLGLNEAQDIDVNINEADITEDVLPDDEDKEDKPDEKSEPNGNNQQRSLSKSNSYGSQPELLYNKARSLLLNKKFKAAEEEFKLLAENYPKHPLAVNSLYWMGECRYSVKDYHGAITIFKQLVEEYPDGRKVPDALLKTAYAYLYIKDADNAREYLKTVVRKFPFSPAGEKAEQKLQSLR
ncbi:MAG: tol-pal system protein YbgF [Desulfamplus sp.]|nr:tol-pal system protein YbgF [Desulfamplus sp.]